MCVYFTSNNPQFYRVPWSFFRSFDPVLAKQKFQESFIVICCFMFDTGNAQEISEGQTLVLLREAIVDLLNFS